MATKKKATRKKTGKKKAAKKKARKKAPVGPLSPKDMAKVLANRKTPKESLTTPRSRSHEWADELP